MTRFIQMSMVLTTALSLATFFLPSAGATQSQRFAEAEVFLELNHTDGDLGLHASIDAEAWTSLEIEGPHGVGDMLQISGQGALREQGLTQLDFESAEPPFDELAPEDFLTRFPEGRYSLEARAQDGGVITGAAHLSHVLAAPPEGILLNNVSAVESCDNDPLPVVSAPVTISWEPVTQSHPDVGQSGPIKVSRYQVFVEGTNVTWSVDLPPTTTAVEVPSGVTAAGEQFKFEIIVRTTAGNNTAVESCFSVS